MATNFDMSRGQTKEVLVESTVESGDPVRVGGLVGVAETDAAQMEDGLYYSTVAFTGVLTARNGELATATIRQGTPIYTSTAAGTNNIGVTATLTTTVGTNTLFGYALNDRSTTDPLEIRLAN